MAPMQPLKSLIFWKHKRTPGRASYLLSSSLRLLACMWPIAAATRTLLYLLHNDTGTQEVSLWLWFLHAHLNLLLLLLLLCRFLCVCFVQRWLSSVSPSPEWNLLMDSFYFISGDALFFIYLWNALLLPFFLFRRIGPDPSPQSCKCYWSEIVRQGKKLLFFLTLGTHWKGKKMLLWPWWSTL